jgi:myosin-light-chain kinase
VRFQCAIAGHPTPWVTWDKDGLLVTPSARLTLTEREDLRILEISEVTVEDAGFYRITLENEVGRVEASARLEVIGKCTVSPLSASHFNVIRCRGLPKSLLFF